MKIGCSFFFWGHPPGSAPLIPPKRGIFLEIRPNLRPTHVHDPIRRARLPTFVTHRQLQPARQQFFDVQIPQQIAPDLQAFQHRKLRRRVPNARKLQLHQTKFCPNLGRIALIVRAFFRNVVAFAPFRSQLIAIFFELVGN